MARRSVLIKSTIEALPSYQMQSSLLPKGVLKEIDKISRSFLWSQDNELNKIHLVSWETITKCKKGLGIKDLESQNKAFIMKLCWTMINKPYALWVQCLHAKYDCGSQEIPTVTQKSSSSLVWNAIVSLELFHVGGWTENQ